MNRAQFTRKELTSGIEKMLAGRLERFGELNAEDAMAMFAMIVQDGVFTPAEAQEVIAATNRYTQGHPSFIATCADVMRGIAERLEENLPAEPASAPRADLDPRLIGRWSYTRYHSTGSFSNTVNRQLCLHADGRFLEDGSASASLREIDGAGRHVGTTSAYTGANPSERGGWKAQHGVLRLDYDNDTYIEYRYETSGKRGDRRLLTTSPKGKQQFWVEF